MPLMSAGTTIFFSLEWNELGAWMKARQNFTSFISLAAYLRYQSSSPRVPPSVAEIRNGNSPAAMIGKRPG